MNKILIFAVVGLLFLTIINLNYIQANSKEDISLQQAQTQLVKDWWKDRAEASNSYEYNQIKSEYVLKLRALRKQYGN